MDHERVFAALFGAYAGCLLAPVVPLALPGPMWPLLAAGFAAAAATGSLTARRRELATSLTGALSNLGLLLVPLGYLPVLVVRAPRPPRSNPSALEFLATPATVGLFALLPGLGAVVAADLYRKRWTLAEATVHVKFEARLAPRSRKLQLLGAGLVIASGFGGAAVFLFVGGNPNPGTFVTYVASAVGSLIPLVAGDDEREVAVTDAGLKVQMQVHDWDTFDDYELTDERLVLERSGLHAALKFDREDIDDVDAVAEALKRYLPRE